MLYLDHLEASVIVLRKLSDEGKECSVKHATLNSLSLRETLEFFRQKVTYFYETIPFHVVQWIMCGWMILLSPL